MGLSADQKKRARRLGVRSINGQGKHRKGNRERAQREGEAKRQAREAQRLAEQASAQPRQAPRKRRRR